MHYYSINLSYEELCKLARTFRLFDNIDEIFDTIKNLIKGINYSFKNNQEGNQQQTMNSQINMIQQQMNMQQQMNQMMQTQQPMNVLSNNNSLNNRANDEEQNVKLERSENDSINLILKIPLLNEKYEKIKIEFKKENKDLKQQFEKMKEKFLKIKKIAFSDETPVNKNQMMNQFMQQAPSAHTILSKIKNEFLNNS